MNGKLKFRCPICSKILRIPPGKDPLPVKCPACRETIVLENVGPAEDGIHSTQPTSNAKTADGPQPISSEQKEKRQTIGRFQIDRKLGEGGFGIVYQAYDSQLERTIALKVPAFSAHTVKRLRRFATEAKSAARLHHPNIVTVYENGETSDRKLYIASEFICGCTLKETLKANTASRRTLVKWVRDIAYALSYAHSEGIIHRDVKPENILISESNGRAKLADFGLARILEDANREESLQTKDGLLGTPSFMSPEQARGRMDQVGPSSDQYSIGAVLYRCLTGAVPFSGSTFTVVAAVAGDQDPQPITEIAGDVPPDLAAICQKAMSKHVGDRYADAETFADDLDCWLLGEPVQARPLSTVVRWSRTIRANPIPAALVGLTIGLLCLVAVLALTSRARAIADRDSIRAVQQQNSKANQALEDLNGRLTSANRLAAGRLKEAIAAKEELEEVNERLLAQIEQSERLRSSLELSVEATEAEKARKQNAEEFAEYLNTIASVKQMLSDGQHEGARGELDLVAEAHRCFEYHYLKSQASPIVGGASIGAVSRPERFDFNSVTATADASVFAGITQQNTIVVRESNKPSRLVELFGAPKPHLFQTDRSAEIRILANRWIVCCVQSRKNRFVAYLDINDANGQMKPIPTKADAVAQALSPQLRLDGSDTYVEIPGQIDAVKVSGTQLKMARSLEIKSPRPSTVRFLREKHLVEQRDDSSREVIGDLRNVFSFAVAPDKETLVCGTGRGEIRVFDGGLNKSHHSFSLQLSSDPVRAAVFTDTNLAVGMQSQLTVLNADYSVAWTSFDSQYQIVDIVADVIPWPQVDWNGPVHRLQQFDSRDSLFAVRDASEDEDNNLALAEIVQIDAWSKRNFLIEPKRLPPESERSRWRITGDGILISKVTPTDFSLSFIRERENRTVNVASNKANSALVHAAMSHGGERFALLFEDGNVQVHDSRTGLLLLRLGQLPEQLQSPNTTVSSLKLTNTNCEFYFCHSNRLMLHTEDLTYTWGDLREIVRYPFLDRRI